ncbi:MAG: tryptophan--tRNA ligase [Candidatus Marsarchaeota archaeon]|nr:tryptophan--tRNA ligase [Candidatus Marsarchaeota archaeon]
MKELVTPYDVEGDVEYDSLVKNFGVDLIDNKLIERIEKLAGEPNYMIRRGIFFAHRDMNWLLDQYEKGNGFYVYTGIAPSGTMTIAHLIPFVMAQWLQEKFDAEVYIQIPDEEKFLTKKNINDLEITHGLAYEDALSIAALGFDKKKTHIFLDTEYAGTMYKNAVRVAKHVTFSMIKDAFGFTNETNIGAIFYTSLQAVGTFIKSVRDKKNVPCLIPLGIDQDVHFRIARDVVGKLGYYKPAIMHSKFLPGLKGEPKMSSSDPSKTIYLNDDPETVKRKINSAITGQQSTIELQKKYGGDPEKCSVCQYYKYLFEPDDKKLEAIFDGERSGKVLAGEHKADLTNRVNKFIENHKRERDRIRPHLEEFMLKD